MSLEQLDAAAAVVYRDLQPTPQLRWPLLDRRCGAPVWVKHENLTPIGSFKARTALAWFHDLATRLHDVRGVVAATRGNFGQAAAFAAGRRGIPLTVFVPHGNSTMKNAAMVAFGAELIERGRDFQESLEAAREFAGANGREFMPAFDSVLVAGAASYSLELFRAAPDIGTMYVPIGLGSGICGAVAARDALHRKTAVVGVVSASSPAYARSFAAGRAVACEATTRIADGIACRVPSDAALAIIRRGVERIVEVTDDEVEEAMRILYADAHSIAEGAGAAGLAALLRERDAARGRVNAIVLTGSNVDAPLFARVLDGCNR